MYEYLKGIITKITAKYIVLETNGIGYILHVANPYAYLGQVNQESQIYVHQVVREDAHLLYGFRSEDEKKLFLSLISVSGIGPVSALAIIAADDNVGLHCHLSRKVITSHNYLAFQVQHHLLGCFLANFRKLGQVGDVLAFDGLNQANIVISSDNSKS